MSEKNISDIMMEIGAYHLCNGCDDTCDFYRNGDCDSIPIHCMWVRLNAFFKNYETEQLKEQNE